MNTMMWLLRREYWEHRSGLRTVPVATAVMLVAVSFLATLATFVWGDRMDVEGSSFHVALQQALAHSPAAAASHLVSAFQGVAIVFAVIQAVVMLGYLLGALYDDRRDRSAWFWSAMPVSNTKTVASKAIIALIVMPLITIVATVAVQLFMVGLVVASVAAHDISPWPLVSSLGILASHAGNALLMLPYHVLIALPVVGWLLLVSAWVHRRPFLWAIIVPLLCAFCLMVLASLGLPVGDGAGEAIGRLASGLVSSPWYLSGSTDFTTSATLDGPGLWWGALAGALGLAGAVGARARSLDGAD